MINHLGLLYYTQFTCRISKELDFSSQISKKHSNIKFYENSPSGIGAFPVRKTDVTKLILAILSFVYSSKIVIRFPSVLLPAFHVQV